MRFSNVVAASLVAPLAAAHGGMEGAPKLFGLPKQLRARNPFAAYQAPRDAQPYKSLHARQSTDGRCGTQGNNQVCASTECCSPEGYCGTTLYHCQAPDCQINYGPACDANKTPNGASTRNDARPQLGSISYGGAGITSCAKAGTVAITYDDGPYIYTADVLDLFKAKGAKATFFLTGNNIGKGAIDENWRDVINRMEAEGHQVASHTWSHQDLSQITQQQVYDQMVKNEMAIRNILGKYPTYMRPPYSSCGATCQNIMSELGYVVTNFDLDTDDYNQLTPEKIQVAKNNFKQGIDNRNVAPADGDKLAIAHDIHELTAHNLTKYMLDYIYSNGLTAVTVGECLNDPKANWYRASTPAPPRSSTASSSAPASSPTGPTSTDATCGGTKGQSCIGFVMNNGLLGECCSASGYCGSSSDYCGTGCQLSYGKCGAQPSASPSASTTGPVPTPTGKSVDGSCGAGKGLTCSGFVLLDGSMGECCSAYGYCGSGAGYCGAGCQAGFGKCGTSSSSSSSVASSSPSSSSAASSSAAPSSTKASSSVTSYSASSTSSSNRASSTPSSSRVSSTPSSSRVSSTPSSSRVSSTPSSSRVSSTPGSSRVSSTPSSSRVSSTPGSSLVSSTPSSSRVSSTPSSSRVSSTSIRSSSSSVVSPSRTISTTSFSTSVRPSSSSSTRSTATPSPSAGPTVSKDGKCGKKNGNQTCVGYKFYGLPAECCNKDTGRCSADPWSCTLSCDDGFGKRWW